MTYTFEDDPETEENEEGSVDEVTYAVMSERMGAGSWDTGEPLPVGMTWQNGGGKIVIEPQGPLVPLRIWWRVVSLNGATQEQSYSYESEILYTTPLTFEKTPYSSSDPIEQNYEWKDSFRVSRAV